MAQPKLVEVLGRPVAVHERGGGDGEPLLLLHGGWAGAEAHWAAVWDALARRRRVLAPELPGVTRGEPLDSAAAYAAWTVALADALGFDRFFLAGNSLGAGIARSVTVRWPRRVRALVLVDGGSWAIDPLTRLLMAAPGGLPLLRRMAHWNAFSPATIGRAFADPRRAPPEIARLLQGGRAPQEETMLRLLVAGDPLSEPPPVPTLVVWGRQDRLIGLGIGRARALTRAIPGARLELIDDAGHLPQVEQPAAFLAVVEGFLAGVARGEARPQAVARA